LIVFFSKEFLVGGLAKNLNSFFSSVDFYTPFSLRPPFLEEVPFPGSQVIKIKIFDAGGKN
jgi:hypothetical protein